MRHLIFRIGSVAIASVMTLGVASASTMEPINENYDFEAEVDALVATAPPGKAVVGRIALDEPAFTSSQLWADFTGETCKTIDEGLCADANLVTMVNVMPHCSTRRDNDCVEGLHVKSGRATVEAVRAGTFRSDSASSFPAIKLFNGETLPASGEVSLWRLTEYPHSGGDLYAVFLNLNGVISRSPLGWVPQPLTVGVSIVPVTIEPWDGNPLNCSLIYNRRGDTCLVTQHSLPDKVFGVSARVGSTFGSWVFGRVADLDIDVRTERGQNLLTVEGRPGATPQAVGAAVCDPGTTFLNTVCPLFLSRIAIGFSLSDWRNWAPYVGPRSDSIVRRWSYFSTEPQGTPLGQCTTAGEVAGWISTNAMVYEATPPTWNGSSLDFSVAGPPFTPAGERASADYEFFLRSSVASCLWPGKDVAKRATVQIIEAGNSSEVTTTSVGEAKGWVRFVARNFGFPDVPQARQAGDTLLRTTALGRTPTISVSVGSPGKRYPSCRAMNKKYVDGVMRPGAENVILVKGKRVSEPALGTPTESAQLYKLNARLDKDRDGLVCEREPGR